MSDKRKSGFTLIELLVVISIIAVLAGLLIPGIFKAMQQAKANRALSEMQHLATVITQVYSEVGYYVPLESLIKTTNITDPINGVSAVKRWVTSNYINGQDDSTLTYNLSTPPPPDPPDVSTMWNGPYTTYKSYSTTSNRPIDPWGNPTGSDADKALSQYRMFWIQRTDPTDTRVPAGATGAMVIISAGGDGTYQCGITADTTPANATQANFNTFDPVNNAKGDDVYYIFNAGIQ